jgi:glycosyltransferase involved in cell wall biosynthesis
MGRKLIVVHSCVLSWWKAVKGEPAPGEWQIYAQAVRKGVQSAEYVVAPTAAMMKAFEAEHGVCACRQVIFNGRDASLYQQREEKEPLVLAAGRLWDEAKNLAVLNRVAGRISWPIYVAGSLDHPSGRPPEPPQVEPLGELPADILADWMSRAAIYVHPARYEPFGLSVLEAALSGCALLLGDIPSLREVWGDAAIYVPPDNADCLRDTLEKLIQHEPRRRELGQLAYRRALQLTPQRMADNYLALYRRLQVMPRQQAGMPAPTPPRRSPFHLRPGASA